MSSKKPKQPSAGMTPAVRAAIAAKKTDAQIVAVLKPRFAPLTERIVREVRARVAAETKAATVKKAKVRVVDKLPAAARQRRAA